jgi:hypothetical protein
VRRAEPRAREHRCGELGNHAHVDRDLRPLADAELPERVRHPDDVALEVGIGDRARVALRFALPVVGDPVAEARVDVSVDAVVGDVELPAEVPLRVRQLPLVERRERLEPRHALASFALPELVEVAFVDIGLSDGERGEVGRRRVAPLLDEDRLDRAAHSSKSYGKLVSTSAPPAVTRIRSSSRTPP